MTNPHNVTHGVPRTPRRIVVGYTEDQEGQEIRNDDTIRASNGRWYKDDEIKRFRDRSTGVCPTYGNCVGCFKCGPVGKKCDECIDPQKGYAVIFMITMSGDKRIIDAEYLARMSRKGQEIAKADRTQAWVRMPTKTMDESALYRKVMSVYVNDLAHLKSGVDRKLTRDLFSED